MRLSHVAHCPMRPGFRPSYPNPNPYSYDHLTVVTETSSLSIFEIADYIVQDTPS